MSILHKKLVGEVVLNIKYSSEELVRLYAHCSPSDTGLSSIVIFGINMEDKPVNLKTEGLTGKGFAYIINTASDLYARYTASIIFNPKIFLHHMWIVKVSNNSLYPIPVFFGR